MFKKIFAFICLVFFVVRPANAYSVDQYGYIFNSEILNETNYVFALQKGTLESDVTKIRFPYASYKEYNTFEDILDAVHVGVADATLVSSALQGSIEKKYPDLKMAYVSYFLKDPGVGVQKNRPDLLKKINEFIASGNQNGLFKQMYQHWIYDAKEEMPKIDEPKNPTETITFAVENEYPPMSYIDKDGNVTGYFAEFIKRFAVYANIKAEIKVYDFDDILEHFKSGEVQVWASNLSKKAERGPYMLFSDPFLKENLSVVLKKNRYIEDKDLTAFYGQPIGTVPGDVPIMESELPLAKGVLYSSNDEIFTALEKKEIVGASIALPVALRLIKKHPKYVIHPATLGKNVYSLMFSVPNHDVRDRINSIQPDFMTNGVFRTAQHIWFGSDESIKKLPPVPEGKRKLVVGFVPDAAPFSYSNEYGEPQGFTMHILFEMLRKLGIGIEKFVVYDYGTIFKALERNEIDVAVGDLSFTRERSHVLKLANPYYKTFNVIIVHQDFFKRYYKAKKEKHWWEQFLEF